MDTNSRLTVPFAVDKTDNICSPDLAQKGCAYFCPACGDSLLFKKGSRRGLFTIQNLLEKLIGRFRR